MQLAGVLGALARAHGQDLALLGLLLGGVRDDQAAGGGLLGFAGLDDDAVFERLQVHSAPPCGVRQRRGLALSNVECQQ